MIAETAAMAGIVMGLAEALKRLGLNRKYLPVVNLFTGVAAAVIWGGHEIKTSVFYGIMAGLSASGLYSGGKNTVEGLQMARKAKGDFEK